MFFIQTQCTAQIPYPGKDPGKAEAFRESAGRILLGNQVLRMDIHHDEKKLKISGFEDKITGDRIENGMIPLFELIMHDGLKLTSENFVVVDPPVITDVSGDNTSTIYAERIHGKRITAALKNTAYGLTLDWAADLRDGSNYIRQTFRFKADEPDRILKIILLKLPTRESRIIGTVDGSPLVRENMFFALEYPLSKVKQDTSFVTAHFPGFLKDLSSVWGVTPGNQLRRGFLYYIERERVHPYHQVLHYNSWFDISWDEKFTEDQCLDRIRMFGDSLIVKRHVPMKAFLFDDGWDDNKTLWRFHPGFPEGFRKVKDKAQLYNSEIGVWLSPFGGYGEPQRLRIEYGKQQDPPFETNEKGFSLAGPVYYSRFKEVTFDFIRRYDVAMFKFDGLGSGNAPPEVYQKDVVAFLKLMKELLGEKPDLYISITTGTWPSVYWLKYGDNIWRGGWDTNMIGEGPVRQQWITYRDADVYANVVKRGPLYPLNALMLCGICIADQGNPGTFEMNEKDISDEIWSFFATGTNLQELYVNPHKLSTRNWNCLADAAIWAKENESILVDTHWIGGDPAKGEVYGYAAWSEGKGILSIRNPSSKVQIFEAKVRDLFELPDPENDNYQFIDAREIRKTGEKQVAFRGNTIKITLNPYEHRVYIGSLVK